MAGQIKLLKISTTGVPIEMDTANDEITLLSYTVTGGPVMSATGIDMNNKDISDANDISWTDPTTDGITVTAGTVVADDLMAVSLENAMDVEAAILFPVITDDADELDAFRLPAIAAIPTATPTDGGEGYLVWRSDIDRLYGWDGAAWKDLSVASEAESVQNTYIAGAGGIATVDAVYISAADTILKAQATSVGNESFCIGFAVAGNTAGNPVEVASAGVLSGFSGLVAGSRYFLSKDTAGAISTAVPGLTGNVVVQVGYARDTDELQIQILQLGRRA